MLEEEESKICRGDKKHVVKKLIANEEYKNGLFAKKEQPRKINVIRSHKHEVCRKGMNKIALSPEDVKRVVGRDGVHTLAWGCAFTRSKLV